jgi:UDP-N-acetylmuramoyl-tripeptide--D-alanyl-D-alanine ligase
MSTELLHTALGDETPMNLSMSSVSEWLKAKPLLDAHAVGLDAPALRFDRVHTDTRTLRAGDLFVALKGEKFDANLFLKEAQAKGALAAICERGLEALSWRGMEVKDTGEALGVLASAWRHQFDLGLIAVTGSNGKTTVTQMLARILYAWQGTRSLATQGNFNNSVGVPMTLLRLRASHRCAVLELGMNHPGEIETLGAWVQPQVALVNNAQREHQEFMGSVRAVAEENAQVFKALGPDGVAVFPLDDEHSSLWQDMSQGRRVCRFGSHPGAEVVLQSSQWLNGAWHMVVELGGRQEPFKVNLPGQHNVHNALASIACAYSLGVPVEKIKEGLQAFEAVKGRSHFKTLHLQHFDPVLAREVDHEIGLVDDSYNANPDSVIAAVDMLARMNGPRVLVLGDMGEVGEQGVEFHQEVGKYARLAGIECLLGLGDLTQHAVRAFEVQQSGQESGDTSAMHFENAEQLIDALKARLFDVQSVLVKGSRFMKMERVVQAVVSENKAKEEISCS